MKIKEYNAVTISHSFKSTREGKHIDTSTRFTRMRGEGNKAFLKRMRRMVRSLKYVENPILIEAVREA